MPEESMPESLGAPVASVPEPAPRGFAVSRVLAVAGFIISLLSFSIGIFDWPWRCGLILAVVGLVCSVAGICRRGARGWALAGIIISLLFIMLTFLLSKILGFSLSAFLGVMV